MLAFSNDYYGMIFRATQSVELFCAYDQYHKNQTYDEIKSHHYIISFDPADRDECGLTGEKHRNWD